MAYEASKSQQVASWSSEKAVQHQTKGQYTIVHKAPEAKGIAGKALTPVYKTI